VGDDRGAGLMEHRVPARVVEMVMGVDDVADRLGRHPADLGDERAGRLRVEKAVDHKDRVIADDEAGIGAGFMLGPVDRGVDVRSDLFEVEGKRRLGRSSGGECREQDGGDEAEDHAAGITSSAVCRNAQSPPGRVGGRARAPFGLLRRVAAIHEVVAAGHE
jgi:hypothetical protein